VRGRDDDAVGQVGRAPGVVGQDGVRDDRRRREAAGGLEADGDAVGGEHFEGRALRRRRQRVGVHAEKERAGDSRRGAVFGDRLGDGEDVRLVEAAGERAAAVAAGAEGDALRRIGGVGRVAVGGEQRRDVGETAGGGRLAGERVGHRVLLGRSFEGCGRRGGPPC
jgi:hypothetical protein